MRKFMIVAAFVVAMSGIAGAAEEGARIVSEPIAVTSAGVCAPLPPVCAPKPRPVCAPSTPASVAVYATSATSTTPTASAASSPATVVVPAKRQVLEEETYTVNVTRTVIEHEQRSRTAYRKIRVPATKEVNDILVAKVTPPSGRAPRISRTVVKKVVPTTKVETEVYEQTYQHPVKVSYTEPVTRTRTVVKYVDAE